MLFFKRNRLPKGNFSLEMIITENSKGCNDIMLDWLTAVWRKRNRDFFQRSGILLHGISMDGLHEIIISKEIRKIIISEVLRSLVGITKKIQPVNVNHCLRPTSENFERL